MFSLDYSDAILLYYLFIAKVLPALVTYFADKYFNIKIRFKSLSLLNASIQNINIKWAGYEIFVGEIGLKSKYLNSEYKKPICVDIEDVKLHKLHDDENNSNKNNISSNLDEQLEVKFTDDDENHNEVARIDKPEGKWTKECRSFLKKSLSQILPPTVMMTLQFIQIRIKNFSTTLLNHEKGPLATISVPNVELLFEGCVVKRRRTLFIALALQHIKSKFIAYNKQNPTCKSSQACLAEIIFDITLEVHVVRAEGRFLLEKQHTSISNTQIIFNGGLFDIIEHFMLHTKREGNEVSKTLKTSDRMSDGGEKLLEKLTPDVMIVNVQQVEVKSLNKQGSFHYHLLLQHVAIKSKFKNEKSVKVRASNLRIYTPIHEFLHVKKLSVDVKLEEENLIKSSLVIDTIEGVYNHEDIYGWFLKIFTAGMKSSRKELIIKAIATMKLNAIEFYHSQFMRSLFDQIIVNGAVECRNLTISLEVDDQISSINASKIKFILNQGEKLRENSYGNYTMDLLFKKRNWNADFVSEKSLCWYMDTKFPAHSNTNESKRTFLRGSALYLGDTFARVSSHGEDFKLDVRVKSLHTEYSNKLTSFSIASLKGFKAYQKLFTQLEAKDTEKHSNGEQQSINIKHILTKIKANVEAADISCFFINRHDVCTFVNLSNFTSRDTLNYQLDTIEVSTVDFSKYDCFYDLSELSTIYISTKQIKVNIDLRHEIDADGLPQLCVDFTEKLDCSWNAHFLRHSLSLIRDFRRFKKNAEDALEIAKEPKTLSLPSSLPVGLDIRKLRNIRIKHTDMNIDKLMLLINELSGENLFFYNYFH